MKRAAIAGTVLLSCIFLCVFLSDMLDSYSKEYQKLAKEIYEYAEDSEKSSLAFEKLYSSWHQKEWLFVFMSGRAATSPIAEVLSCLGGAVSHQNPDGIRKESVLLISKFNEFGETNSVGFENFI